MHAPIWTEHTRSDTQLFQQSMLHRSLEIGSYLIRGLVLCIALGVAFKAAPARCKSSDSKPAGKTDVDAVIYNDADSSHPWKFLFEDSDVKVWHKTLPNTPVVAFKGIGNIETPYDRIATIVWNDPRKPEWNANCVGSRATEYFLPHDKVGWVHLKSPFFVFADRDMVLRAKIQPRNFMQGDKIRQGIRITFGNVTHPKEPERKGVVRMPKVAGYWDFEPIGDGSKTRISYVAAGHPGGLIPPWLANWTSRWLPVGTIQALRKQAQKTGYQIERQHLVRVLRDVPLATKP